MTVPSMFAVAVDQFLSIASPLRKVLCHNLRIVIQSQHELGIKTSFTNELTD